MLYHVDLGIPQTIRSSIRTTGLVLPKYSQHARDQAAQKHIELPDIIDFAQCRPCEIECKRDGTIQKVVYRLVYKGDPKCDLVLVIHPADNFVRTVWLNAHADMHATLDRTKYEQIAP